MSCVLGTGIVIPLSDFQRPSLPDLWVDFLVMMPQTVTTQYMVVAMEPKPLTIVTTEERKEESVVAIRKRRREKI